MQKLHLSLDPKFIKTSPQYIYIYIYRYQTRINNQTQIAKEEEENAAIVEEQGVEEEEVAIVAVNGES